MSSVSNDPVREVVFAQSEWDRVAADVKKALTRSGCILPQGVIDAMTGTVLEESLATRRRMAFMINAFINEYGDDCNEARLSRLEAVMLLHQRDKHNMPYMPNESDD